MVAAAGGQVFQVVDRPAFLPACEVGFGDRSGQPVVAVLPLGQHQQVRAFGIRDAVLGTGQAEGELGAVDGGDVVGRRGLGEAGRAVEPVVVGQRDRVQTEPHGLLDQLLGGGGAVEEAEVGVAVQFGVGDDLALGRLWLVVGRRNVRSAVLTPGGGVAAIGLDRAAAVRVRA
ncbi:hypothetical protein EV644_15018 [Kribbella orskensis]|uniref:Uncharacterized protein n=1 Tax=Kribbella orskensis TaxID=2512216 RepID=A0ABY2B5Y4_9ACTN|nr:hypothetical protein EV642_1106 [Kribbella sp. VKM Ac-2500]TCO08073.1 hypothetical protein EV644_15018 [Kribbella orskensis]